MIETKYIIDKENRVVICILTTFNDVPNKLSKYKILTEDYIDLKPLRSYKGIAKCAPEDEWDENYGRQLAEYKASRLRQIDVNNELKKYIKHICRGVDDLIDFGMLKDPHYPELKEN